MKDKQIIVRCTKDFKEKVQILASLEGLTMSAYITRLLKLQMDGKKNDT